MKIDDISELLYQALETELGGVKVYRKAISCAINDDLREEWTKYLEQTEHHVEVMRTLCESVGLDPATETPGRRVVRHIGSGLVQAMDMALGAGNPDQAQLVAAECVVHAETKDHLNWELIGELANKKSKFSAALEAAHEEVEEEEDEHLYHTKGWTRELWIDALGLKAVLPPPEEEKDVKTAIGAERAKNAREQML